MRCENDRENTVTDGGVVARCGEHDVYFPCGVDVEPRISRREP